MKLGFIGCGNMASAIIEGVISNNLIDKENTFVYDINKSAVKAAEEKYGVQICENEKEVIENSDCVVLAVKPNTIADVLQKINTPLDSKEILIISIAAGKTIEFIRSNLTHDNRIVRVMPNINAKVRESISAYCMNSLCTDKDKKMVEILLDGIGKSIELNENTFPIFGVLGGCAPAYSFMFIDALARAGVQNGMKKDEALMIAAQTVYGSAKMILESNEHPWELIDRVCSPGGTTIEGVLSLQSDGLETSVHNAVENSLKKDKKL